MSFLVPFFCAMAVVLYASIQFCRLHAHLKEHYPDVWDSIKLKSVLGIPINKLPQHDDPVLGGGPRSYAFVFKNDQLNDRKVTALKIQLRVSLVAIAGLVAWSFVL